MSENSISFDRFRITPEKILQRQPKKYTLYDICDNICIDIDVTENNLYSHEIYMFLLAGYHILSGNSTGNNLGYCLIMIERLSSHTVTGFFIISELSKILVDHLIDRGLYLSRDILKNIKLSSDISRLTERETLEKWRNRKFKNIKSFLDLFSSFEDMNYVNKLEKLLTMINNIKLEKNHKG